MSKYHLNRRHFLQGLGVSMALPFLEIMLPSRNAYAAGAAQRFVSFYFGNGIIWNGAAGTDRNTWECTGTETNFTLSRALQPLNAHKDVLTVIHNMSNPGAKEGMRVDGTTGHWLASSSFLTGQRYNVETHSSRLRYAGSSLDQMIGEKTTNKFKSLVMGNNYTAEHVNDPGGPAEVLSQVSWRSQTEMVPRLTTSKAVFDRLFSTGLPTSTTPTSDPAVLKRHALKLSVVDAVREDSARLFAKLGAADKMKMDQYLTAVNELEKRIKSEAPDQMPTVPTAGSCSVLPTMGSHRTDSNQYNTPIIPERARNMMDMLIIAFQCDLTRVSTIVTENEVSQIPVAALGGTGANVAHHTCSHWADNPSRYVPAKTYFGQWQAQQMAYLLGKLKTTADGVNGGMLIDNTLVHAGSGMGDSHIHSFDNLPILLAGRGVGHRGNRLLRYPGQNYANFLATIAGRFGLPAKVGMSNGTLNGLF